VFSLLDGSPHLLGPRPVTRELSAGQAVAPPPIDADALPSEPAAMAS